jgi:hypothetical protein
MYMVGSQYRRSAILAGHDILVFRANDIQQFCICSGMAVSLWSVPDVRVSRRNMTQPVALLGCDSARITMSCSRCGR